MKLFVVRMNSDMIEGRGPMIPESVWFDREKAVEHMDKQFGIMGRRPRTGSWDTENIGGDWEIKEISTEDEPKEK